MSIKVYTSPKTFIPPQNKFLARPLFILLVFDIEVFFSNLHPKPQLPTTAWENRLSGIQNYRWFHFPKSKPNWLLVFCTSIVSICRWMCGYVSTVTLYLSVVCMYICVYVFVSVRPRCCSLSWAESEAQQFADTHGDFDLLLGADVVFWPDAVPLLIQTVRCFLARRVCCILCLDYLLIGLARWYRALDLQSRGGEFDSSR